jgi:beta-glucanase (GH16 family)
MSLLMGSGVRHKQFLTILGLAAAAIFALVNFAQAREAAPPEPSAEKLPRWRLVWDDEFSGPNGSAPDSSKWVHDIGGNGWGNQELEYYTGRLENARIEDGMLVITARREHYTGADGVSRNYTSARLKTLGLFAQQYGRFEARIKIPRGQGLWPAFWMLGVNFGQADWPDCGEIDIMEDIGREPSTVHGTIHGPGYSGGAGIGSPYSLAGGASFAGRFHVFALEWEPDAIRFSVDKTVYKTITPANLPPGKPWVFDHPFFILLNLAVGGSWPGNPDSTTRFPQQMLVDYVRVYQRDKPYQGTAASASGPGEASRGRCRTCEMTKSE